MNRNNRFQPGRWLKSLGTALTLALCVTPVSHADDTEIYANETLSGLIEKPLIMLTLDYRSNLNATSSEGCDDSEDLATDGPCGQLVEEGYLDTDAKKGSSSPPNKYTALEIYLALLKKVFDHVLGFDESNNPIRVRDAAEFGFTMNHGNDNNCAGFANGNSRKCSNGAMIIHGFQDLTLQSDFDDFFLELEKIPIPNQSWNDMADGPDLCSVNDVGPDTKSHSFQGAELYFELFRYFTGQGVYNGHNGWNDFGTGNDYNLDSSNDKLAVPLTSNNLVCASSPSWDPDIEEVDGGNVEYISPLEAWDPNGCGGGLFVFNFLFFNSNQEADSNCAILDTKANGGMAGIAGNANNCKITTSGVGQEFVPVLEWMNQIDLGVNPLADDPAPFGDVPGFDGKQNVTSYFFVPDSFVNNTSFAYANAGGTLAPIAMNLFDVDLALDAILSALQEVLSVSTTFVSPTLPANVFNRTDLLNQVYLAIFQADPDKKPRWTGNLKRYHINRTTNPETPFIAGDDGFGNPDTIPAVDTDGRIKSDVLSVWTHPEDIPAGDATTDYQLGKDGRSVVHGGSGGNAPGYRLLYRPGYGNPLDPTAPTTEATSRRIFTEPSTRGSTALLPIDISTEALSDALAIDMLQIGDGTSAPSLPADDYQQIKIELWQALMPACVDPDPAKCLNYNVAIQTDRDTAIAKLKDALAFVRGYKAYDPVEANALLLDWFFGDPLHSRPEAINYGGPDPDDVSTQDVRIAITTNDGVLHFIRANDSTNPADNGGVESWAFTPRSVTKVQHRLQSELISDHPLHPYGLDSNPEAVIHDANNDGRIIGSDGDWAMLVFGMRRGGKHIYALDITDPDAPSLAWTIRSGDAGFEELDLTFSSPQRVDYDWDNGSAIEKKIGLIFGAGYNGDDDGDWAGAEDNHDELGKDARDNDDPTFTGSNDYPLPAGETYGGGNAVYIIDALTGNLVWKATGRCPSCTVGPQGVDGEVYYHDGMVDSIPSIVTAVNATSPSNLADDRAYVGDTGGRIWRLDFDGANRMLWKITKFADLGRHFTADQENDRRFFHASDFLLSSDNLGSFDGVVIGSGNRANPLSTSTVNYLYVLKDRYTNTIPTGDYSTDHDSLQDLSDNCLQDGNPDDCDDIVLDADGNETLPKLDVGWRLKLEQCTEEAEFGTCGEKGLSQPLVLFGNIFFNSYIPTAPPPGEQVCALDEGQGQSYLINVKTAAAVEDLVVTNTGDGETPSLDRSFRLDSGGIPSDPVLAGSYPGGGIGGGGGGGGGGSCPGALGVLLPDLKIDLLCGIGLLKKYWYTTEPE